MADIGEAKLRLTAQDDTAGAFGSLQRNLNGVTGAFDQLKSTFAALGIGLSVGAFASFVKQSIDAAAALDDMAESTGATVEGLSRMSNVARITGADMGNVQRGLIELNKVLSGISERKGAAEAIEAIGLSMRELQALKPDQAMEQVARALAEFEDGAGKTAVAVALLGRSGAELLPLLKDLTNFSEIQGNVTAEQAAAAEELANQWRELGVNASNLGQAVALEMVPAFNDFFKVFTDPENSNALRGFHIMLLEIEKAFSRLFVGDRGVAGIQAEIDRLSDIQSRVGVVEPTTAQERRARRTLDFRLPGTGGTRSPGSRGAGGSLADDALDAMRRQMQEEERLIKEMEKQYTDAQEAINKGWVEIIDQQIEGERIAGEAAHQRALEQVRAQEAAAEEARRAWERQADIISSSLTDALMRGFEDGKDFAENFKDTLKNLFQTLVLRPIIQPIVTSALGAIGLGGSSGAFGGGFGTPGFGGGGSIFNTASTMSNLWGGGSLLGAIGGMIPGGVGSGLAFAGNYGLGTAMSFIPELLGAGQIGAAIGAALPAVGIALMAASALGLFGGNKSPATGIGVQGTGTVGLGGFDLSWIGRSQNANQQFSWPTFDNFAQLGITGPAQERVDALFAPYLAMFAQLGIDPSGLRNFRAPVDFMLPSATGIIDPQEALRQFEAALGSVSEALNREFGPALQNAAGLLGFQQSLATSAFVSPMERIGAAQAQYSDLFERALAGDQAAIQAFPTAAQGLLGIGREVYATGAPFGDLFRTVNTDLNRLLDQQRAALAETTNSLGLAQVAAAQDQLAATRAQTTAVVSELQSINSTLRRLAVAPAWGG